MREEPLSKEIPEEFKPSDYHLKAEEKAHAELEDVSLMSLQDCQFQADQKYRNEYEAVEGGIRKTCRLEIRYKKLLAKVEAWKPPTKDHIGLKEFMLDQIRISMPASTDHKFYQYPVKQTGESWKKARIEKLIKDIEYHHAEYTKECQRNKERNNWIKSLRKSLEEMKP
jgi:hypothetical protein